MLTTNIGRMIIYSTSTVPARSPERDLLQKKTARQPQRL